MSNGAAVTKSVATNLAALKFRAETRFMVAIDMVVYFFMIGPFLYKINYLLMYL